MTEFYRLDGPESERRWVEWDKGMSFESVICPATSDHRRAGRRIGSLKVVLPSPPLPDFLWTWYSDILVTDETLSWLHSHEVSGFEAFPASGRFRSARAAPAPSLHELVVTGWGGVAGPETGVTLVQDHPCCGHRVYTAPRSGRALFESATWDGSDLFMIWPLPMFRFISERLANLIRAEGRTGLTITPATDIVWGPTDGLGPGRLSDYMPSERALELGGSLGIA